MIEEEMAAYKRSKALQEAGVTDSHIEIMDKIYTKENVKI